MKCRVAESMINGYINHTLSVKELESFLDHISSCPSCYDELETHFIVHRAVQQLEQQGPDMVTDFKGLLTEDIRRARKYILRKRILRMGAAFFTFLLVAALAAVLIFVILQYVG